MRRVMIVGGPGSGKSTLARWLGQRTGLPVQHMDLIHWQENWIERPKAEKVKLANTVEQTDAWIIDGSLRATYHTRLRRADTLIWLDLPVGLRLWRVTKRRLQYWGRTRPDMPRDCPEGFNKEVVPFYRFIWTTRRSGRAQIARLLENAHAALRVVHLQSRADVRRWQAKVAAKLPL